MHTYMGIHIRIPGDGKTQVLFDGGITRRRLGEKERRCTAVCGRERMESLIPAA